jgi:hypothetical protein
MVFLLKRVIVSVHFSVLLKKNFRPLINVNIGIHILLATEGVNGYGRTGYTTLTSGLISPSSDHSPVDGCE